MAPDPTSTRRRLLVAAIALCAVAGCRAATHAVAPRAEPAAVPGIGLDVDDGIGDLAAAVDAAGRLCVAWLAEEVERRGNLPHRSLSLACGTADGWQPVRRIAGESGPPLLLIAQGGALHLFDGPRLRHRLSRDGGATWSGGGELLPAGQRGRIQADAVALPGGWAAAWTLYPRTPYEPRERTAAHRQRLYLFDSRRGAATEVADFEASTSPPTAPALAVGAGRLHVAVGLHVERPSGRTGGRGIFARLVHLAAPADGGAWSPPAAVLAGDGLLERDVRDLDLAVGEDGLVLAWSAHGVHVATSADGTSWSPPRHLNPYEVTAPRGDLASGAVALSPAGRRLAWIDGRHTRSDRRWWKPLGGLPWSDDVPFWANRDLFLGRPGEVGAGERLTADLASAELLEWAAGGGEEAVVWSGRRRVGRTPRAAGEAPQIFFHRLPPASSPAAATLTNLTEESMKS